MRTTVTLDPDVERLIRDAMRERAISFKEALTKVFRWDKALAVADPIEDEELSRKLTPIEPEGELLAGIDLFRLTTRPGLFRHPLTVDTAFALAATWLDQPSATIVHPGPRCVRKLSRSPPGRGP